jgi:hypothetical protein
MSKKQQQFTIFTPKLHLEFNKTIDDFSFRWTLIYQPRGSDVHLSRWTLIYQPLGSDVHLSRWLR